MSWPGSIPCAWPSFSLPRASSHGSHTVAELIRRRRGIAVTSGTNPSLTASVGTATYPLHAPDPARPAAAKRRRHAPPPGGAIAQIQCAQALNSSAESAILSRN